MRVLLIDDHTLVRKGLEQLLASRGVEVVASVGSGREGIAQALALQPDIILLDVKMPEMSGTETLKELRAAGVVAPILMLTMSREESDLQAALRNGATGYLLKDMDHEDLVPALQDALRGNNVVAKELIGSLTRLVQGQSAKTVAKPASADALADLTPRELEILRHLAEGQSNKAIGRALDITDGTVKLHVKSILRKLGARSRVEAAVFAVEHGLGRKGPAAG
jgi:two-component system, NarL family, nitrate/nitrite response regulator NarL